MAQYTDPNDFLFSQGSGGAPAFKFENPGDTVSGSVVGLEMVDEMDFQTKKPKMSKFKPDETVKQLLVTLQTSLTEYDGDDGVRRVFVKPAMKVAIYEAATAVGLTRIDEGAGLEISFTGWEKSQGGFQKKTFSAKVTPVGSTAATPAANKPKVEKPAHFSDEQWAAFNPEQQAVLAAAQ